MKNNLGFYCKNMSSILTASYHQGDPRFKGCGRQCMANSVQGLLLARKVPPSQWTKESLDNILDKGDKMYTNLNNKAYMSIDDIPTIYDEFTLHISEPVHGTLYKNVGTLSPLEDALREFTQKKPDNLGCIFTMGTGNPYYSCAVIKDQAN